MAQQSDSHFVCCSVSAQGRHVLQNAQAGGPLKGAAFWNFLEDGQQAPAAEGGGSGLYGIKVEDSTFNFVRNNANAMKGYALFPFLLACMAFSPHGSVIN